MARVWKLTACGRCRGSWPCDRCVGSCGRPVARNRRLESVVVCALPTLHVAGAGVVLEEAIAWAASRLAAKVIESALFLVVAEGVLVPHGLHGTAVHCAAEPRGLALRLAERGENLDLQAPNQRVLKKSWSADVIKDRKMEWEHKACSEKTYRFIKVIRIGGAFVSRLTRSTARRGGRKTNLAI
eukprot:scaffold55967_cov61-Phaeocystis_antarctica.AAC.4